MKVFNLGCLNSNNRYFRNIFKTEKSNTVNNNTNFEKDYNKFQSFQGQINRVFINYNNLSFEGRKSIFSDGDKEKIIKMHTVNGMTQQEITDKFGCSDSAIGIILRNAGIRTEPKITDEIKAKAIEMYTVDNMSQRKIADVIGYTQATVGRALKTERLN